MAPYSELDQLDYMLSSYGLTRPRKNTCKPTHVKQPVKHDSQKSNKGHNQERDNTMYSSGCEYCKKGYNIVTLHKSGLDVRVSVANYAGHRLLVSADVLGGRRYGNDVKINYCPMCGKKL